ncbi:MAG: exonuclease SbcCD subunit D [Candidatus Nanopelagicales bacterium]
MRLLHTSDWHLGRSFHRVDLAAEQGVFLDWLLEEAVRREVDAVLVAGDVFDRAVPPVDAVRLASRSLAAFAAAGIPVVVLAGNHDSATRLGFGAELAEAAGVHVRTRVEDVARPVVLHDEHGPVHVYAVPYLDPDVVHGALGVGRSHAAVLGAAMGQVRDHLAGHPARSVVVAHAFVSGGAPSDSERDIRVGGVHDVPASLFDGVDYVALGHLHRAQAVHGSTATIRYSGSPLAYSFSEAGHRTSVTVVDVAADGGVRTELVPTPVPRPVGSIAGRLDDLLADPALADREQHWLQVTLTDPRRPDAPLEALRSRFPHVLVVEFRPEGGEVAVDADLARLRAAGDDPVEVGRAFLAYVAGGEPTDAEMAVLATADELARRRRDEPLHALPGSAPRAPAGEEPAGSGAAGVA